MAAACSDGGGEGGGGGSGGGGSGGGGSAANPLATPIGVERGSLWRSRSLVGFAGALHDSHVGLRLMRSRWYDPALGTWLTRDPAGYADGMCLYRYVRGNPLVYFDPFGMQAEGAPAGSQKQLEEELGIPRGTGRADNRGMWSEEEKEAQQRFYDELNDEFVRQGAELIADSFEAGIFLATLVTPGPDELIVGALIAKHGWKIRAGKLIDKTGKAVSDARAAKAIAEERKAAATTERFKQARKAAEANTAERVTGEALARARKEFERLRPKLWQEEARRNPGRWSKENLERMRRGQAPLDSEGKSYHLHHKKPLSDGGSNKYDNVVPMTEREHIRDGNYKKNHPSCPPPE